LFRWGVTESIGWLRDHSQGRPAAPHPRAARRRQAPSDARQRSLCSRTTDRLRGGSFEDFVYAGERQFRGPRRDAALSRSESWRLHSDTHQPVDRVTPRHGWTRIRC
jgi:hypothetical protein